MIVYGMWDDVRCIGVCVRVCVCIGVGLINEWDNEWIYLLKKYLKNFQNIAVFR